MPNYGDAGFMSGKTGTTELARLAGKDLNNDGKIINLVVVGSSRLL